MWFQFECQGCDGLHMCRGANGGYIGQSYVKDGASRLQDNVVKEDTERVDVIEGDARDRERQLVCGGNP